MTKAKKNIHYVSPEISQFYLKHRSKWDDFYPSEKWILNRLAKPKGMYSRVLLEPGSIPEAPNPELGRILDVGCAAGGLFLALSEKFHGLDYWGVDINSQAIEVAQQRANKMNLENCHFKSGDILEVEMASSGTFDVVFSLSCADWNLSTNEIMKKCWQFVKPGGNFVISLRLSSNPSIKVFSKSFQYIFFGETLPDNLESCEKAPYVVLNFQDSLKTFNEFCPGLSRILGYGYFGKPSHTARTPYDELCFTVFAVEKCSDEFPQEIITELHLPLRLFLK